MYYNCYKLRHITLAYFKLKRANLKEIYKNKKAVFKELEKEKP